MVETPTSYCFFVKINGRDRPQRQKRVRNDRHVIVWIEDQINISMHIFESPLSIMDF